MYKSSLLLLLVTLLSSFGSCKNEIICPKTDFVEE